MPPVLERVDEPSLRRQLDNASRNQVKLEERVERVVSEAKALCELDLFDSAMGLISEESAGVRRAKGVQALLQLCIERLACEDARLSAGMPCGLSTIVFFRRPEKNRGECQRDREAAFGKGSGNS